MSDVVIVIPARLESERLKNKLLSDVLGKPLIAYTIESAQVLQADNIKVVVATDASAIAKVAEKYNCPAILTTQEHKCGTNRVFEAYTKFSSIGITNCDYLINWQGDEPELDPGHIRKLIAALKSQQIITTLATPADISEYHAFSVVKVVFNADHRAMYFSRLPIPCNSHEAAYKHIGIYGFPVAAVERLGSCDRSKYLVDMMEGEKLEQLEWLYRGFPIHVVVDDIKTTGIDTKDELISFISRIKYGKSSLRTA